MEAPERSLPERLRALADEIEANTDLVGRCRLNLGMAFLHPLSLEDTLGCVGMLDGDAMRDPLRVPVTLDGKIGGFAVSIFVPGEARAAVPTTPLAPKITDLIERRRAAFARADAVIAHPTPEQTERLRDAVLADPVEEEIDAAIRDCETALGRPHEDHPGAGHAATLLGGQS